ncbi:hypothetical protein PHJA_000609800 [Phtheirospermum japonicum]|uniref:Uncharacterized protein n=1 Tax=Phtheirospermum japonicum TaxID=374723 RepID=A0A830BGZ4_9LAMI|nr:hypothetical protein PHJA_000609800 [Phtheirospermum japonicum]
MRGKITFGFLTMPVLRNRFVRAYVDVVRVVELVLEMVAFVVTGVDYYLGYSDLWQRVKKKREMVIRGNKNIGLWEESQEARHNRVCDPVSMVSGVW